MSLFLTVYNTYNDVLCGLFTQTRCIAYSSIPKHHASRLLVPTLQKLFAVENTTWDDVTFCAVGQGPGPFTTLRTVIATMNGISFATGIPLVGVNLLEALVHTYDPHAQHHVVGVLNAFGGDVYYAVQPRERHIYTSCGTLTDIADLLASIGITTETDDAIHVIGNARDLCADVLQPRARGPVIVGDVDHASLEAVAELGFNAWHADKKGVRHLSPIYLKNHPAMDAKQ